MQTLRRYINPDMLREGSLVFLIVAIFLFFGTQINNYFNPRIFSRVLDDVSIITVVAIGETLVLLTRNYDLSVGSIVGLVAFVIGKELTMFPTLSPAMAILSGVGMGVVMGLINGVLVAYGKVPSIVTTFGTMAIYRAILINLPGNHIVVTNDLPDWIVNIGGVNLMTVGGFPIKPVVAGALVILIIFQLVITFLPFGRRLYAIGSNPEAARMGGLPAARQIFLTYIICGGLAGVAGFMYLARYGYLTVVAAQGMEMMVIAAAVVGGVSTNGGIGTMVGALLGGFIINLLQQSLLRWQVITDFWVNALLGLFIIVAVTIDTVIVGRLRAIWSRTGLEIRSAGGKTASQKEESHVE